MPATTPGRWLKTDNCRCGEIRGGQAFAGRNLLLYCVARRKCRGARPEDGDREKATQTMAKAIWNGKVIAESDQVETVEGNLYFPDASVNREYLRPSTTTSTCPWKGQARYYTLVVDGQENQDAAWYYPDPKPAAKHVKNHMAFWRGVEIEK